MIANGNKTGHQGKKNKHWSHKCSPQVSKLKPQLTKWHPKLAKCSNLPWLQQPTLPTLTAQPNLPDQKPKCVSDLHGSVTADYRGRFYNPFGGPLAGIEKHMNLICFSFFWEAKVGLKIKLPVLYRVPRDGCNDN